jgi:hypothetical protein
MSVNTTPQAEERAARERLHAIKQARAAKAKADARRRAAVIREELARPRAKDCRCPITADSRLEDLTALGAGRTAGRWVCPHSTRSSGDSGDERNQAPTGPSLARSSPTRRR